MACTFEIPEAFQGAATTGLGFSDMLNCTGSTCRLDSGSSFSVLFSTMSCSTVVPPGGAPMFAVVSSGNCLDFSVVPPSTALFDIDASGTDPDPLFECDNGELCMTVNIERTAALASRPVKFFKITEITCLLCV